MQFLGDMVRTPYTRLQNIILAKMDAILTTIFQESNNTMASLTINIELENFVITSSEEDATNITSYGQTTESNVRCRVYVSNY